MTTLVAVLVAPIPVLLFIDVAASPLIQTVTGRTMALTGLWLRVVWLAGAVLIQLSGAVLRVCGAAAPIAGMAAAGLARRVCGRRR